MVFLPRFQDLPAGSEQSTLVQYSVVGGVTSVISDILTSTWWSSFQDLPAGSEQSILVHYSVVGGVTSVISDRLTTPWWSSFQDLPAGSEQSTLVHCSVVGGVTSVISDRLTATWRDLPPECFQPMRGGGTFSSFHQDLGLLAVHS